MRASETGAERSSAVSEVLTLAAAAVRGSDGVRLGRVEDVYLTDREGELVAVSVAIGRFVPREVLVPVEFLRLDQDGSVTVSVPADAARRAPEPPVTGHLRPADLDEARAAFSGSDGASPSPPAEASR